MVYKKFSCLSMQKSYDSDHCTSCISKKIDAFLVFLSENQLFSVGNNPSLLIQDLRKTSKSILILQVGNSSGERSSFRTRHRSTPSRIFISEPLACGQQFNLSRGRRLPPFRGRRGRLHGYHRQVVEPPGILANLENYFQILFPFRLILVWIRTK